jgi:hypothetical protein
LIFLNSQKPAIIYPQISQITQKGMRYKKCESEPHLFPSESATPSFSPAATWAQLDSRPEFALQKAAYGFIGLARHPGDDPDPVIRKNLGRIPVDPPANKGLHAELLQFLQPLTPIPGLERKLLAFQHLAVLQIEDKEAGGAIEPGGNPGAEYGDGNFHMVLDDIGLAKGVPEGFPPLDHKKNLLISRYSRQSRKDSECGIKMKEFQ